MPDNMLEQIQTALSLALQADLEHGVAWLNDEASKEFARKYPQLNHVIGNIMEMEVPDGGTEEGT